MSQKLKIYIVEDEAITMATIKSNLQAVGYEIAGSSDEAELAWEEMKQLEVDLAIIDINLIGDKTGIWLAEKIHQMDSFPFIFLTAYSDKKTVEEALTFKPNGYLIKPFEEMDLYTAIKIGIESFSKNTDDQVQDSMIIKEHIFIKEDHLLVKLKVSDIRYIKSDGNYLDVHVPLKKYIIRNKLSDLAERLPSQMFVKVHQRYVINMSKIETIGTTTVKVEGVEIPISKSFKENLLSRIETF